MAAARAPHGVNAPPKIIYKKIYIEGHGGHHGGAWKVAYADFVTAMMAFFLLLWILGATTEKQRKALADYFAPTLVELKQNSAGSNGCSAARRSTSATIIPARHRRPAPSRSPFRWAAAAARMSAPAPRAR
jgi:chemotaxis protein MotB